ncbi:MAG: YdiU family protein [Acidimicrobiales bacterium]|nr:YdiU family protein [Acidimicrobiales bacterium]
MSAFFAFENTFAAGLPELVTDWQAVAVPTPRLVAFNAALAGELGADPSALQSPAGIAILAGNEVPEGARPVAMAYAGHQFGGYSPRLGDGRALLLGEVLDTGGVRRDLHLKGSGRTPFARSGDGKATVGPMLREFLLAEAMFALGIPTNRALAVVTTGEQIQRQRLEPGALLTRVAGSHLRVGTFEYAARLGDPELLRRLADYTITRHYPELAESASPYLSLLERVIEAQAQLVARWMLVGFIHGVLNTDNVALSGDGIDYGPCAFMDQYDPATVFSSIDHGGRYAYGNQPGVTQWNLTRFAETLVPLIDPDVEVAVEAATTMLEGFPDRFGAHWSSGMGKKLGLTTEEADDTALFRDLLDAMQAGRVDFTAAFRSLAAALRGDGEAVTARFGAQSLIHEWLPRWTERLAHEGDASADVAAAMDAINPIYIPRNHLVDEALNAATEGDYAAFEALDAVLSDPFTEQPGQERYAEPAPADFNKGFQTFCGT